MARKITRANISLYEINIQIALGTLTQPMQIAAFIECTTDTQALIWASKHKNHKNHKIRNAAIGNPVCPISTLIKACIRDKSAAVTHTARAVLEKRRKEIDDFLLVTESYPQLSFSCHGAQKTVDDSIEEE